MKKILLITIILGTLFFMSCNEPKVDDNPFIGTWEDENNISGGVRYIFTETHVEQYATNKIGYPDGFLAFNGTYTYNNTHITIVTDFRYDGIINTPTMPYPLHWTYSFNGDILTIAFGIVKKIL